MTALMKTSLWEDAECLHENPKRIFFSMFYRFRILENMGYKKKFKEKFPKPEFQKTLVKNK